MDNEITDLEITPIETAEVLTEPTAAPKVELTREEQMAFAIKIATEQQKALYTSVKMTLRALLNMLTTNGLDGAKKERIKQVIETSLIAGLDYGVDVGKYTMEQKGVYAKYEGYFAAQIARTRENGMILLANSYKNKEETITGGINDKENNAESGNEGQTSSEIETSNEVV